MLEATTRRACRKSVWAAYNAKAEASLRTLPLYASLLGSRSLGRLRRVSFLGAIELPLNVCSRQRVRQSRYEHSVGVAYLTLRACAHLQVPPKVAGVLIAGALLHDVGHGALSHSTEPYFSTRFRISHKHVGDRLIAGDLFLGRELRDILGDFGIESSEVRSVLQGGSSSRQLPPLFSLPINVDTLDGIIRAAAFFGVEPPGLMPEDFLPPLVAPSEATIAVADRFWKVKASVYRNYIQAPKWAIWDHLITRALLDAGERVRFGDFLLCDDEFCDRFSQEIGRVSKARLLAEYKHKPKANRRFYIKTHVRGSGWSVLSKRYLVRRL